MCYPNGTCNDGLECLSSLCVSRDGTGGASVGRGGTGNTEAGAGAQTSAGSPPTEGGSASSATGGASSGGRASGGASSTRGGSDAGVPDGGSPPDGGGGSETGGTSSGGKAQGGGAGTNGGTTTTGGASAGGSGGSAGASSQGGKGGSGGASSQGGKGGSGGLVATGGNGAAGAAQGGTGGSAGQSGTGGSAGASPCGGAAGASTLFLDTFECGIKAWTQSVSGSFVLTVDGSNTFQRDSVTSSLVYASAGASTWTNVRIEARVKALSFANAQTTSYIIVYGHFVDTNNYQAIAWQGDGTVAMRHRKNGGGSDSYNQNLILTTGEWYTLALELNADMTRTLVNGMVVQTTLQNEITPGRIAIGTANASARFDDVRVTQLP